LREIQEIIKMATSSSKFLEEETEELPHSKSVAPTEKE